MKLMLTPLGHIVEEQQLELMLTPLGLMKFNPSHGADGRFTSGGGGGGGGGVASTGSFDEKGLFHTDTKPYRGMQVDRELNEGHLDRLNTIPADVISTNAGAPELQAGGLSAGGGTSQPSLQWPLGGMAKLVKWKAKR